MKASSLIGCDLIHTTDPGISGKIIDLLNVPDLEIKDFL